jgi:hypothetical protein
MKLKTITLFFLLFSLSGCSYYNLLISKKPTYIGTNLVSKNIIDDFVHDQSNVIAPEYFREYVDPSKNLNNIIKPRLITEKNIKEVYAIGILEGVGHVLSKNVLFVTIKDQNQSINLRLNIWDGSQYTVNLEQDIYRIGEKLDPKIDPMVLHFSSPDNSEHFFLEPKNLRMGSKVLVKFDLISIDNFAPSQGLNFIVVGNLLSLVGIENYPEKLF